MFALRFCLLIFEYLLELYLIKFGIYMALRLWIKQNELIIESTENLPL
jgi:hypothetical protein